MGRKIMKWQLKGYVVWGEILGVGGFISFSEGSQAVVSALLNFPVYGLSTAHKTYLIPQTGNDLSSPQLGP